MNVKNYLIVFLLSSLVFLVLYVGYTIPAEIDLGATSYQLEAKIVASFVAYLILTIAAAILVAFSYKASRPLAGLGRKTMEFFTLSLLFYMLGPLSMTIGLGIFIILGESFRGDIWYGYIYLYSLPVAMMFTGIAPYFMLKFGYLMAERREPSPKSEAIIIVLIGILLAILAHPYNWYGTVAPRIYPDWRIYSNSILLLVNLIVIIWLIVALLGRIREETDPIRASRLKMVMLGFLFLLGFFICYTLDALSREPFTIWMFLGFFFATFSPILLYIGVAAPKWYISIIQKRK